jgi:protease-4
VVFFVMASLGVAVGLVVFVFAFPGKPKIGVIHVPFTVIEEQSAYVIGEYLSYARQDDSIKAVVVKLTSPGGGAAASERLYNDTRSLRDEKPVVMAMDDLVASGGYMMAMGANHSYTTSSSIVGNVGVVSMVGPLIPPVPEESLVYSGPYKLSGLSRRDWIGMINQLKQAFAEMVVAERRGKLRISAEELAEARIYSGVDAVRLGLVDEIGATTDALEKAAELAGITNYTLVDVNVEVQRRFAQDLARILEPLTSEGDSTLSQILTAPRESRDFEDPLLQSYKGQTSNGVARLETLRELALSGILSVGQEDPLPQLPLEMNHPNFYYLYLGHAP